MATSPWQDWLILLQAPGVGPVTWGRLIQRFGSPTAVIAAGRKAQQAAGLKEPACNWLENPDLRVIKLSLAWLEKPGNHLIPLGRADYPPLLAGITNPPPMLFVTGNPEVLCQPQIAIVGTRNPTSGGRSSAWEFARSLAAAGYTITSGLAIGIDAAAHEGALTAGTTIAISATGPDRVYPTTNLGLAQRITQSGAIATELLPGTQVQRENFPQRNRIISGLCLGVLVVEAASKSGSLITAKTAVEQNREVFAVPGSIHNPQSKGCHALIRQGAKLVETAEDIVEELGSITGSLLELSQPGGLFASPTSIAKQAKKADVPPVAVLDQESQKLLDCLGHDPVAQEALIQRSGLTAQVVSQILFTLELNGYISTVPGGRYCRVEYKYS